jgi:antitoxin component of RelBE/YafQ-DinJ toxin-antitoxin module
MSHEPTESVRIDKELLERIKVISKAKGQTISGYINVNLYKVVDRHWQKTINQIDKKNNIQHNASN